MRSRVAGAVTLAFLIQEVNAKNAEQDIIKFCYHKEKFL